MTDSEFWRDLGAKFQALQPSGVIGSYLTASWTSGVWNQTGAPWLLSASDPQVKDEFVSLAEEAAAKYGGTRLIQNADERWKLGGETALFFWLDVLKRESGKYKSDHGPVRKADGSDAQGGRGKIMRVCEASAIYCGRLARRGAASAGSELPLPVSSEPGKGAIRMGRPSRSEIDKSAGKAFAVDRKRILAEYETKLNHLPAQVGLAGNSGGYLPALITWGKERVREMIVAWVDAYVDAFTSYGVPSDTRAETDLKAFAQQITAGSIAATRGQLKLRSIRIRIAEEGSGVPWHLEIERAMDAALDEGLLSLESQRIKFRDANKPLQPLPDARELPATEDPVASTPARVRDPAGEERLYRRSGDSWELRFGGKAVHVRSSKGMRYIAELLRSPRKPIAALALVTSRQGSTPPVMSRGIEVADEETIVQVQRALKERQATLSSLSKNDWDRRGRLKEEIEKLEKYVSDAAPTLQRRREFSGTNERARTSVTNAIDRALRKIRAELPEMADHLEKSIRKGYACIYLPEELPDWEF